MCAAGPGGELRSVERKEGPLPVSGALVALRLQVSQPQSAIWDTPAPVPATCSRRCPGWGLQGVPRGLWDTRSLRGGQCLSQRSERVPRGILCRNRSSPGAREDGEGPAFPSTPPQASARPLSLCWGRDCASALSRDARGGCHSDDSFVTLVFGLPERAKAFMTWLPGQTSYCKCCFRM